MVPRLAGRLAALVLAAAAAAALAAPAAPALADTVLGARDKVRLSVARWDPASGEMRPIEWLRGDHTVDEDGALELPVAGRVPAAGLTPSAVAADAAGRIGSALGIVDGVHAALEVVERAPFFVIGAVERPGSFPYRPGLTALQAVALAGGVRRTATLFSRTDRDAVNALGEHRLGEVERWRILARIARLEAELADRQSVTMPPALTDAPMGEALIESEQAILEARRDEHELALAAIADLKTLLGQRIEKLKEEMTLREDLLTATRDERAAMTSLVERGLARTSRVNEVARALAELEARMLALETQVLAAEQQLSEAARDEIELVSQRRVTVVTELQDARTSLTRVETRLEVAEALFAEAARFAATLSDIADQDDEVRPTFVITRQQEDGARPPFVAGPSTTVLPGDVLEVRAPRLEAAPGVLPGRETALTGPVPDVPSN